MALIRDNGYTVSGYHILKTIDIYINK